MTGIILHPGVNAFRMSADSSCDELGMPLFFETSDGLPHELFTDYFMHPMVAEESEAAPYFTPTSFKRRDFQGYLDWAHTEFAETTRPSLPVDVQKEIVPELMVPEMSGLAHLCSRYGTLCDVWPAINHPSLNIHTQGVPINSLIMQLAHLARYDPLVQLLLDARFSEVFREGHVKIGSTMGLYFSLIQRIRNPRLVLEHFDRVDMSEFQTHPGQDSYPVLLDLFDPVTEIAGEIKFGREHEGDRQMPQGLFQEKLWQAKKQRKWVEGSPNRRFEYHLLWHLQKAYLRALYKAYPEELHHRVMLKAYVPWNLDRPHLARALSETSPGGFYGAYYDSLRTRHGRRARDAQSLQTWLRRARSPLKKQAEKPFYTDATLQGILVSLDDFFSSYMKKETYASLKPVFDRMRSQWAAMAEEDLDVDVIAYHNKTMFTLLAMADYYIRYQQFEYLFDSVAAMEELLYDTRPYHPAEEEHGVFANMILNT